MEKADPRGTAAATAMAGRRAAGSARRDPALWTAASYKAFCAERERMLAAMLRDLLATLGVA